MLGVLTSGGATIRVFSETGNSYSFDLTPDLKALVDGGKKPDAVFVALAPEWTPIHYLAAASSREAEKCLRENCLTTEDDVVLKIPLAPEENPFGIFRSEKMECAGCVTWTGVTMLTSVVPGSDRPITSSVDKVTLNNGWLEFWRPQQDRSARIALEDALKWL